MEKQIEAMTRGDLFAREVRVVMGHDGEPWFVAKDVCEVLGIGWYRDALATLDDDEGCRVLVDTLGGRQEMAAVSESGLYTLILRSRKPEARAFKRWVTHEVLPAIRKTGLYSGDGAALAAAMMRARDYMHLRGVTGSVHGLGMAARAVCRRRNWPFAERRGRGHEYPLRALDEAARKRPAERGPLAERPSSRLFVFDPARKVQGGAA